MQIKSVKTLCSLAICLTISFLISENLSSQRPEYLRKDSIISKMDGASDVFYYVPAVVGDPQPLVVELHSWSNSSSSQNEILAQEVHQKGWNYILPNFRGVNNTVKACCSEFALSDIDQTIDWAIKNLNVDRKRIYIAGYSGGGYATFAMFMKSRHKIADFSAWCGISDLVAWYDQSLERKNKYGPEILLCTGSGSSLDVEKAKSRSPLFWKTPVKKRKKSFIQIYAGIHDGHTGSVPISQSLLFYNKIIEDAGNKDPKVFASNEEIQDLLNESEQYSTGKSIQGRAVRFEKKYKNISICIFEGGHYILRKAAIEQLK